MTNTDTLTARLLTAGRRVRVTSDYSAAPIGQAATIVSVHERTYEIRVDGWTEGRTQHIPHNEVEILFTDATWEAYGDMVGQEAGQSRHEVIGWDRQHDLAVELRRRLAVLGSDLSHAQVVQLISASISGLPVQLTWETWLAGLGKYETTTAMVVITSVTTPAAEPRRSYSGQVRIRYSGFGHPVCLSEIVDVQSPEAGRSYLQPDYDLEDGVVVQVVTSGAGGTVTGPRLAGGRYRVQLLNGELEIHRGDNLLVLADEEPDREEADPIDLQDEARGDFTPGY